MVFKKKYINELSSGEFNYALYDKDKHDEMFDELENDKYYKSIFLGFKESAMRYADYVKNKKEKKYNIASLVVEQNDYPVGLISLRFYKKTVEMNSVVRPHMRNMGIKKLIVLDLCEFLYEKDIKEINFMIGYKNIPNRKSVEGIGAKLTLDTKKHEMAQMFESDMYVLYPSYVMYKKKEK